MSMVPSTAIAGNTRVIADSFAKALPLVHRLLAEGGLRVTGEFDLSKEPYFELGIARRSCAVLLVDSPVLLFEAIALDRSAAVFLPVHVVISGDRDTTYVHWANPIASSGLRPPVPAKGPLENLCALLTRTLAELPQPAEIPFPAG
jgi:uncharacterized protein (DUF302 family)